MRYDINIYLEGKIKDQLEKLVVPGSPFKATEKSHQSCIFWLINNLTMNQPFVYRNLDEALIKNPVQTQLHKDAQNQLQFVPGSWLHYQRCSIIPKKEEELEQIMGFLAYQEIGAYLTYTPNEKIADSTKEKLVMGQNPKLPEMNFNFLKTNITQS